MCIYLVQVDIDSPPNSDRDTTVATISFVLLAYAHEVLWHADFSNIPYYTGFHRSSVLQGMAHSSNRHRFTRTYFNQLLLMPLGFPKK